jgi:hypothetical protein
LYAHPLGFHELLFIMARCRRLVEFNAGWRGRDRGDRRDMASAPPVFERSLEPKEIR